MKCPFCSNRLRRVKSKSAVVDICTNCRGIWFDSGEFVDFVRTLAQSQDISAQETKLFKRRDVRALHTVEEKDKCCPKCNTRLHKFNYAYDSNVFLDRCPLCGGIWTDAGEVREIAGYLKEDPTATAVGRAIAETFPAAQQESSKGGPAYLLYLPRVIVPLSDDTPRQRFPLVTVSIIALCTLLFITRLFFDPRSLTDILNLIPEQFWAVDLIRSMFLSGGFINLAWNVLFLWLFGDNVEDRFSRPGYLVFFLCSGLFAGVLYSFFDSNLSVTTIGISGAVSAVMGAYFVFYPAAKIKLFAIYRIFEIPAVVCLGAWFLFQFVSPFIFKAVTTADTLCFANISGFVLGAVVACFKKGTIEADK
jgi:membrane associated rhomboid family serine protease/Zn-finger nucleic acid-binding protein